MNALELDIVKLTAQVIMEILGEIKSPNFLIKIHFCLSSVCRSKWSKFSHAIDAKGGEKLSIRFSATPTHTFSILFEIG